MTTRPIPASGVRNWTRAELLRMDVNTLPDLFREDFHALTTLAVADATMPRIPRPIAALLRGPEFYQDWQDALRWAEGELQVSSERMAYLGDDRLGETLTHLARVRTRICEAGALAKTYRVANHHADLERKGSYDVVRTVRLWLTLGCRARFEELVAEACAEMGVHRPANPPNNSHEAIEWGVRIGLLVAPLTGESARLAKLGQDAFRDVVADDAREQTERNPHLRHPLVLARWREALIELLETTGERIGVRDPAGRAVGPLRVDLRSLESREAMRLLNGRRFFCAIGQRWIEQVRITRVLAEAVGDRFRASVERMAWVAARDVATDRLINEMPDAAAHIRRSLDPYLREPGGRSLDPDKLSSQERECLKKQVFAELGLGAS